MSEVTERYYLESDDDGHWYVVPVSKREAFDDWLNVVYTLNDSYEMPEGVVTIGGAPSLVTFPSFTIGGD